MEKIIKNEEALKKLLYLILLSIFILLFIGIINYDTEFGNDFRLFIKYPPSLKFYIECPPDTLFEINPTSYLILEYEKYLSRYNQLKIWNNFIPFLLIQLFLITLFFNTKRIYQHNYLFIDIPLFIFSYFILMCTFYLSFGLNFDFLLLFVIFILSIVIANYFIWIRLRFRLLKLNKIM